MTVYWKTFITRSLSGSRMLDEVCASLGLMTHVIVGEDRQTLASVVLGTGPGLL